MRTYSVSDASKMLNVNEETVRRWIRDGKLKAKRAVGRGGNSMVLDDIVAFANNPPRAYLLSLESWLTANGIAYQKIEDLKHSMICDKTMALGAGSTLTGVAVASALTPAALAVGAGIGIAYSATKLMKRKNYQTYSIQLVGTDETGAPKAETATQGEDSEKDSLTESTETLDSETPTIVQKKNTEKTTGKEDDEVQSDVLANAVSSASVLEEIAYAKQLLDSGIITQDEFASIKARLIAKI